MIGGEHPNMALLELFRITKIGYWISAILGGTFVVALLYQVFSHPIGLAVFVVVWIFICACVFNFIAAKRVVQIDKLLTDDCDLVAYRDIWQTLSLRKLNRATAIHARLNLSTACLTIGDMQSAGQVLSSVAALVLRGLPAT